MGHQLRKAIVALVRERSTGRFDPRAVYPDDAIARVFYGAVIHDRPTAWAVRSARGPAHLRRGLARPSAGTMSRRRRTRSVRALLDAVDRRVLRPPAPGVFGAIDGKPLPVGGASTDRQAGYGRAVRGMARGYKPHPPVGPGGSVAGWRVAPMNADERVMARRRPRAAPPEVVGYVVGDGDYDSSALHRACDGHGGRQRVTPRRGGPGRGTGHRRPSAGRVRSIDRTESPFPALARGRLHDRAAIERQFGNRTNWGGGLGPLPAWVRTHRRVARWVQAKRVRTRLKQVVGATTCDA